MKAIETATTAHKEQVLGDQACQLLRLSASIDPQDMLTVQLDFHSQVHWKGGSRAGSTATES